MKKKKLRLKRSVKNVLGVVLFYALIVGGVISVNKTFEEQQKSATESEVHIAQNINR